MKEKITVDNRRAHPRREATLRLQGTTDEGGVVARMIARNLSAGGLYCTSNIDFPEMTRLAVRLMLPLKDHTDNESEPLDAEAVVVRRLEVENASNGDARFELALYFTRLETEARERLDRFLSRSA